ncbi:MAG: ketoacyl-ACP synthase III [Rhizobiales bacterium]|nr:ketoacyl-ACP synthase III [Hyphomicrobiales bacterium]
MIGIIDIAYYLPERRVSNFTRAGEFALTDSFINDKLGVKSIALSGEGQETSDLCVAAAKNLFSRGTVNPADVDCVVVVTQNPDGHGLPHTSAIVHAKLGLPPRCLAFDIGLGCSGFVAALSVVTAAMQSQRLRCGLLFTADPYSKIIDRSDRNTALLFGDGASVTLLGEDPVWEAETFDFVTTGDKRDALIVRDNGLLHMNGRAVFEFCATAVPESIRRTAQSNGITLDDIDRFVLHHGSKFIVDTIAARLGINGRAAFDATDFGNTVSSSVPVAFARNVCADDNTVLISGFGVGLSIASAILRRAGH